eukprot:5078580-Karenia_brevis.AAC.1
MRSFVQSPQVGPTWRIIDIIHSMGWTMSDPWTINRGPLPPLSILSENRATMKKAFGLAANQMLGHGIPELPGDKGD